MPITKTQQLAIYGTSLLYLYQSVSDASLVTPPAPGTAPPSLMSAESYKELCSLVRVSPVGFRSHTSGAFGPIGFMYFTRLAAPPP